MIRKAIRDKLLADAAVTADLPDYDFGGVEGTKKAIFAFDSVDEVPPQDAKHECIIIRPVDSEEFDTRGDHGGRLFYSVTLHVDRTRRNSRNLARLIWLSLDKSSLTHANFNIYGVLVDPPVAGGDRTAFPEYRMELTCLVEAK